MPPVDFEARLDEILSGVLDVTLTQAEGTSPRAVRLHLAELADELQKEGVRLQLTGDIAERALVARLMQPGEGLQPPFGYLLDVYARAGTAAASGSPGIKDAPQQEAVQAALRGVRTLAVSYAHILLTADLFPQPQASQQRGPLQILDALDVQHGALSSNKNVTPMPRGFLEELVEAEGLEALLTPIVREMAIRLGRVTLAGDYQHQLNLLAYLCSMRPIAVELVKLPHWLGIRNSTGRNVEVTTLLGRAFALSPCPGHFATPNQYEVADMYFGNLESRAAAVTGLESLRVISAAVQGTLAEIVLSFLKNKETREPMLEWLTNAIEANAGRDKEMVQYIDYREVASDGFFVNLSAVLLKLCEPFLDPASGKAWPRLDLRRALANNI